MREILWVENNENNLESFFDAAYFSHIIQHRKPDASAFQYVLKRNNLKAQDTLFIDDSLLNIKGAREVGLQTFHIEPGVTIEEDLFN